MRKQPTSRSSGVCRLEALEARSLLTTLYVVPLEVGADGTHLHDIAAAVVAAAPGDVVQVEPGASLPSATVSLNTQITLRGDSNVPTLLLPQFPVNVNGSSANLTHLNLGTVTVAGGVNHLTLTDSTVSFLQESSSFSGDGSNVYRKNDFTGGVALNGNNGAATNDLFDGNTFNSLQTSLMVQNDDGLTFINNTVLGDSATQTGIIVNASQNITVSNNTFRLTGANSTAIDIHQTSPNNIGGVINNNIIDTNGLGTGINLYVTNGPNFAVSIQGNDFHGNFTGVNVFAPGSSAGTAFGTLDIGGGATSVGGNNFRGFTGAAGSYAIKTADGVATGASIPARNNLFANGVSPASVVNATAGSVDTGNAQDTSHAFVQSLYNLYLGRAGTAAELQFWVDRLPTLGRVAVVNDIGRSAEAYGLVVDDLYVNILGRHAEQGGKTFWTTFMQNGGSVEDVSANLLGSAEYASRIGSDYVQSLYLNLLHRVASPSELGFWNSSNLGRGAIAKAFLDSSEHRDVVVRGYYNNLLHRTVGPAEIAFWTSSSLDLYSIKLAFTTAIEYFNNG